jgi:tryptophan 7-halogenase
MPEQKHLKEILIVGGGSAGWMTAALFSQLLGRLYSITLVESDEISTVGVGEATIPAIKRFNALLAFDEIEFMRKTQGSFKLGVQFVDWWRKGESYIHSFGPIGQDMDWLRCHQFWLKARAQGQAHDFSNYAINAAAALQNKFQRADPALPKSPLGHIAHAYHFDAGLYARYLRGYAEERGVQRIEGKIVDVALDGETGDIASVTLQDGAKIRADFFIDCSGFRGLLIGQALKTGYEEWGHWLPCDRAMALPCERSANFAPYTRATAHDAGWQWRIPLQHRTGNGHVYASAFTDDDRAETVLRDHLDAEPTASPLKIRYSTGMRRQFWNKNCVAIGLAAGFLEPLESTSLYLVQSAAVRLIKLFPDFEIDPANIAEYNRQTTYEYERCRDFIILHYKATERDDTEFWRYCRNMSVPDTLQRKWDLFAANGRIFREDDELFAEESWIQVFLGQGVIPRHYDPSVDLKDDAEVARYLGDIERVIEKCCQVMPSHADYVDRTCRAPA